MTRRLSFDRLAIPLGCLLWWLIAGTVTAQQTSPLEFRPRTVIPKAMPAIVTPEHIAAADVTTEVAAADLVLGVVVNGEARAYPISMLTGPSREIINDELGKQSIAATW